MANVMLYRIKLDNYTIPKALGDGSKSVEKDRPYEVRKVMYGIMLSPNQGHKGFRFHTVSKVASKILNCTASFIELDATEYAIVKESFDNFSGFGPLDAEMVQRVYEPERVEKNA